MSVPKYWIAVVSKEHALLGVAGGFIQVCHGKQAPLRRMQQHDWVAIYSPKQTFAGTERLQSFTTIGQMIDDVVYQFEMTPRFIPFRRNVRFRDCTETPILPLIESLRFIPDKKHWGFKFRYGFFEITASDFMFIRNSMLCE